MHIVLGVGGGIAAYKSASLLREFTEAGHSVQVVPTQSSLNFVGQATWEALSGNPVLTTVWQNVDEVPHVSIGKSADLVVVAPATADLMSRIATGAANDLLTNVLLTATCPIVLAPAMHTEMWLNAATVANVATLRQRGITVIEPAVGRLTGQDSGPGRMPEPHDIANIALGLTRLFPKDLAGVSVVVTAGGTREYLDPVRYLGNKSSGKQGVAIARAALERGATVRLIAANMSVPAPAGVQVVNVETGDHMLQAMRQHSDADVVVMAAAVADFAPRDRVATKIKKSDEAGDLHLDLHKTTDILADTVERRRAGQIIVGFAAETGDSQASVLEHGNAKLARKGCDFLVVNDVSDDKVFGQDTNEVVILSSTTYGGGAVSIARADKGQIAHEIWNVVAPALSR